MQLLRNRVLTPPGLRVTSWRIRSGGRVMSITVGRSLHRWFNIVKRNIARFVPLMKNALAAPRVVMMPAVAVAGTPVSADCGLDTRWTLRSTLLAFSASYMALFAGEYVPSPDSP